MEELVLAEEQEDDHDYEYIGQELEDPRGAGGHDGHLVALPAPVDHFQAQHPGGSHQVGVLKSYDEANSLKNEAVTSGITDAFIVAWRDGQKISVEEVLKR